MISPEFTAATKAPSTPVLRAGTGARVCQPRAAGCSDAFVLAEPPAVNSATTTRPTRIALREPGRGVPSEMVTSASRQGSKPREPLGPRRTNDALAIEIDGG